MNILSWILFGLIVGIIANMLDEKAKETSTLLTMTIGVGGAILGGIIGNIFFGASLTNFNVTSFMLAALGALLLLFVRQTMRKNVDD